MVGTNEQIEAVCELHIHLLLCLDRFFGGMHTKCFNLTAELIAKMIKFRDCSLAIMRHLSMSLTPKDHYIEDHSVQVMIPHEEMSDLGEDQGEHNHQLESKVDLWLRNVQCFRQPEVFKSQQDGKKHDPGVQNKIVTMFEKHAKRKTLESTEARRSEKRQKQINKR
jgi:hypothetical protein